MDLLGDGAPAVPDEQIQKIATLIAERDTAN